MVQLAHAARAGVVQVTRWYRALTPNRSTPRRRRSRPRPTPWWWWRARPAACRRRARRRTRTGGTLHGAGAPDLRNGRSRDLDHRGTRWIGPVAPWASGTPARGSKRTRPCHQDAASAAGEVRSYQVRRARSIPACSGSGPRTARGRPLRPPGSAGSLVAEARAARARATSALVTAAADRRLQQRAGPGPQPPPDRVDATDHAGRRQQQPAGGPTIPIKRRGCWGGRPRGGGKNGAAVGSRPRKYSRIRRVPTA